ncbi:hypothetical protein SANTM175S_04205 [Streptomyces antimycoticus]
MDGVLRAPCLGVALGQQPGAERQPVPLQPQPPVARDPLGGGAQPRQPRDQSDAGVAEAGEVLDQLFDGQVCSAHT